MNLIEGICILKKYGRYDKANINCQITTPSNKKTFLNLTNVEGKTGEYGADYEADDIGYYQLKATARIEDISGNILCFLHCII